MTSLLATPILATDRPAAIDSYASVRQLQQQMDAGTLDSRQLTQQLIQRIHQLDQSGPTLRAVLEINPDAMKLAGALDAARAGSQPRSPLYGIPVLLKDNIDTDDRMLTSAGSLAMVAAPAARDAGLVERLRKAGALILGKTNLSEWANFRSNHAAAAEAAAVGKRAIPTCSTATPAAPVPARPPPWRRV